MPVRDEVWNTNVSELVATFRSALVSLVPWLQKSRIPVGVHAGTDGWDDISETLFRHFVAEVIRWSRPRAEIDDFELPAYEMTYETYAKFAGVIEVVAPELSAGPTTKHFVFHGLKAGPDATALDVVVVRPVDEDLAQAGEAVEIPYSHCQFRCLISRSDGNKEEVQSIEVAL